MPGAGRPEQLAEHLTAFYQGSAIIVVVETRYSEMILRQDVEGGDGMTLHVNANADGTQARLVAHLDNLGKGASGAAIQNLNIMCGLPETAGLRLPA